MPYAMDYGPELHMLGSIFVPLFLMFFFFSLFVFHILKSQLPKRGFRRLLKVLLAFDGAERNVHASLSFSQKSATTI